MSRRETERRARELVLTITALAPGSANFDLATNFVASTFRFHRYLDVDRHKVTRAIDGIHEKLLVHSDGTKAASWRSLTSDFLRSPLLLTNEHNTEAHYAVLFLLLALSGSPTQMEYVEWSSLTTPVVEEAFDWLNFLREDVDSGPYPDTSEWSEEEEEEEKKSFCREDSGIQADHSPVLHPASTAGSEPAADPESSGYWWLRKSLVRQYWAVPPHHAPCGPHPYSNLGSTWAKFVLASHPLSVPQTLIVLTEAQLVRETLWLLTGSTQLFAFQVHHGKVAVRDDIGVTHLTPESLRALLGELGAMGEVVLRLQAFVDGAVRPHAGEVPCRTLQAVAFPLAAFLQDFRRELAALELRTLHHDVPALTLLALLEELRPRRSELLQLALVLDEGTAPPAGPGIRRDDGGGSGDPAHVRAARLVNALHRVAVELHDAGNEPRTSRLLLSLLVSSLRPLLDMCGDCLTLGCPHDPAGEFILQRNDEVVEECQEFWEKAFTLRRFPECSGGGIRFLAPILDRLLLIAKSRALLLSLQGEERSDDPPAEKARRGETDSGSLHQLFVRSLLSRLGGARHHPAPAVAPPLATATYCGDAVGHILHEVAEAVGRHLLEPSTHDPLLAYNFSRIYFDRMAPDERGCPEPPPGAWDVVGWTRTMAGAAATEEDGAGAAPLDQTLGESLYPHVQRLYLCVCGQLMAALREQHGMMDCLQAARGFFLLEAGDAMLDFCAPVFERALRRAPWRDTLFLDAALQMALHRHPHAHRLTVELEEEKEVLAGGQQQQPINALDGLTLHYEAPWPVSLVLSPSAEAVYRQVFTLLLQIKWVKHSLDTLCFSALMESSFPRGVDRAGRAGTLAHRMFLLRVRFMHIVNGLHTYVLTRILHSTWLEFRPRLDGAGDLDELLAAHAGFLAAIHDRCLLRDRVSYVKQAIMKVCNLALVFADRWRAGPTALRAEVLARTEGDLRSCHVFLLTVLNKAVRRGSFPHLESLALALAAGMEQK